MVRSVLVLLPMGNSSGNITIHTRRFYRVVLERIDGRRETLDSFAIKLSMATRTPIKRAKQIGMNLPHTIKSNLSAPQANRLKSVVEEIGGIARLEAHLVTPGEKARAAPTELKSAGPSTSAPFVCPSCGWEEKGGAMHCPMCLRKFRDPRRKRETLKARLPEDNPLEFEDDFKVSPLEILTLYVKNHQLPVLIGIILVLLLIVVFK
jgi:hypothetical protein